MSIEEKNRGREVRTMAIPVLIEVILGSLFGMVDMMMLGRYGSADLSAASIAAVGATNQLMFLGLSLVQALNVGGTSMIARYVGQNREDRIESVVKHIVILTQILIVLPVIYIGLGHTEKAMKFFGAQEDMIRVGASYFKVIILGFIFQAFNNTIFAALRGVGDTKTPMKINLFVNFLNVLGNAVLIYGLFNFPELGALGAATSTSLCQLISTIILIGILFKKNGRIKINLRNKFRFDGDIIFNMIKIGIPAAIEQLAMRIGVIAFLRIISKLGTAALATHQISLNIINLTFGPGSAFGIAAATLVGMSLGEGRPDLAEGYIYEAKKYGRVISIITGIVFFVFGEQIASLYTSNEEVIFMSKNVLKLIAFVQPFQGSQLIIAGGLRGAGDTVWTMITSLIGIMVIRVILAAFFVNVMKWGIVGAWLGTLIDQSIRWFLNSMRLKSGKWKTIEIR